MISLRKKFTLILAVALSLTATATAHAATTATPYGGTTDAATGGHGDLTTGVTFDYGADGTESVRRVLIDLPAGGVGNPNAIPWADRCSKETFETAKCSAASQIGVITISAKAWVIPGLLSIPLNDMSGSISQIQTDPEIPTLVGAYIEPPLGAKPIRAYARFYPVTNGPDGDFRIRSETDPFPVKSETPLGTYPIQITKYEQKLFGRVAGGQTFITNPTRCDTWNSWGYAEYYNSSDGANSDPFGTGTNTFFKTDAIPTTPDCTTLAPFDVAAEAQIDASRRGEHAALTVDLKIDGLGGEPLGSAAPKSVTTTLPKGVTIDVAQLGRVCSEADFAAFSCPASTQVGTAAIETPMIVAGLTGEAHLLKSKSGQGLPDLGIHVHGAINFNLRGTNRFVNINQLETTFDDLPQVGFSRFKLNLVGGNNGLLIVNHCPSNGSDPADGGRTQFAISSYQGQALDRTGTANFKPESCIDYTVSLKAPKRCVTKKGFKLTPKISPRSEVRQVRYYVRGKYVKKVKRSPWGTKVKISRKLKKGKRYGVTARVFFAPSEGHPKGHVVSKTTRFKLCR